ncbi:hypothetical protein Btru_031106 [Bulinus truncatus]|nr:hypothetical protein Btru_031106 [Bulinus truncatus]
MHNDSPKWLAPSGSLDNAYPSKCSHDGNNNQISQNLSLTQQKNEQQSRPILSLKAAAQPNSFPASSKSGILPVIPSHLIMKNPIPSGSEKNRTDNQKESGQSLKNENKKEDVEELDNSDLKSQKGSPTESDSSCELASVNRIIDAANAQSFHEYLIIPENEDELDEKSESVSSSEDSNQSMENLYSNSQSFNSETLQSLKSNDSSITKQDDSNSEEGSGNNGGLPSVTVNVALMDNALPKVFMERQYKQNKKNICDPSNMSEQAIAELIEKVSKENSSSPAKKKRNSYADSPHKFSCPYCSRCFPWLSSLNRHLLTHTGQKPFKCPRCPVTFSTKSNRERHLIRKHNVNMLDPASRSTMDRPYKCHLCVFSSFSTQSNLIKHYKDRHDGVSPPAQVLEMMDRSLSDGEGEDSQFNANGASYEDEEEYNSLVQMRGLSDKEIMLQNYSQDSNHGSSTTMDPHKKRNAIFNLGSEDDQIISKLSPIKSVQGGTTRPGIDDTVLTDTMKQFLDKSVKQAVEDSRRRAMEKGSKFILTPYIERHLRHLPSSDNVGLDLTLYPRERCPKCDKEFLNQKILIKHLKHEHGSDLPYKCHICESSFSSRVDCLQHQAQMHQSEWNTLKDKNDIGNVQVFGTRLDKKIEKLCKRGRDILEKQGQKSEALIIANKNKKNSGYVKKLDLQSANKLSLEDSDKIEVKKKNMDATQNGEEMADKAVLEEVITSDYLQRKVYCAMCPKRFWSMQDLKRHMRSHTGERPYRCDICFQKFTLKHSMKRHKANHHPDHINTQDATSDDDASGSDGSIKAASIAGNIPSLSVLTSDECGSQTANATTIDAANDSNNNENKPGSDNDEKDMLHNLLGVESSTIDQIFESNDSAASLLGVPSAIEIIFCLFGCNIAGPFLGGRGEELSEATDFRIIWS